MEMAKRSGSSSEPLQQQVRPPSRILCSSASNKSGTRIFMSVEIVGHLVSPGTEVEVVVVGLQVTPSIPTCRHGSGRGRVVGAGCLHAR